MKATTVNLWENGYRAEIWTSGVFRVWRPKRQGSYLVDVERGTCQCVGYGRTGRCKHLRFLSRLLLDQCLAYASERKEMSVEERGKKDNDVFEMLRWVNHERTQTTHN